MGIFVTKLYIIVMIMGMYKFECKESILIAKYHAQKIESFVSAIKANQDISAKNL